MSFLRILPFLALVTTPAFAGQPCVTAEALKSGVRVTVKDGSVQSYRAKGRDVVAVVPTGGFTAELVLARGLHVTRDHRTEHEAATAVPEGAVMVGGNDGGTMTTDYSYASLPKPGKDWAGVVKISRDQDGPSIGPQPKVKGRVAATVAFLPEETVTISGCSYRIQPVETVLSLAADSRFTVGGAPQVALEDETGKVLLARRQIWFPDLGFAVITRERGAEIGWSEDWGQGITALAAE
ncbi:MAG: hypothetical protein E6Q73_08595 [Pseudorhodobacter sp.]|nr:MAG: hypothetical protein E6Q73_08595 [Pseudorhodobacter sp.]